jgi:WD40 repeat protein
LKRKIALEAPIMALAKIPGRNEVAVGDTNGVVRFFSPDSAKPLRTWSAHKRGILALATSSDGEQVATGSFESNVGLWNAQTGELIRRLDGHSGEVRSLDFSKDDKLLAVETDVGYLPAGQQRKKQTSELVIWDVETARKLDSLLGELGQTWSVAFSDGALLARCDSGIVEVLDTNNGRTLWSAVHK